MWHHKGHAAAGASRAPAPHVHPCTHAAHTSLPRPRSNRMHPGRPSVADSAQPRPGRHDQVELGVDVAVGETRAPAAAQRVDGSSSQID
eukprot:938833-Prymnesium_polylepis.1